MSTTTVKTKLEYVSDASNLVNGTKQAKAAVRDFSKTSEDALAAVGGALGVDTGKVEKLTSAIQGMGIKMTKSGNEAVASLGKMLSSLDAVKLGIAGLGIGAAIASFKALDAVAQNFKTTVEGANLAMASAAYSQTFKQVFFDAEEGVGRAAAKMSNFWEETKTKAEAFGTYVLSQPWKLLRGGLGGVQGRANLLGIYMEVRDLMAEASAKGEQAREHQYDIEVAQQAIAEKTKEWVAMETEIARLKNVHADKTNSQAERQKALSDAQALIVQRYTEEYNLQALIAEKMDAINELAKSGPEALNAANEQWAKAKGIQTAMESAQKRLISAQNEFNKSAGETVKTLSRATEKMLEMVSAQNFALSTLRVDALENPGGISGVAATSMGNGIELVGYKEYMSQINELTSVQRAAIEAMNSGFADLVATGAEAFGELVADIINGENAWKNFGTSALSALGNFMESIGKAIIKEGVAIEAAKLAAKTLKGAGAIVAGVSLVAIGAALKKSLSNAANGSYAASSSSVNSYAGAVRSTAGDYFNRQNEVKVTGTLRVSGTDLVAAITNENNRTSHTT